MVSGVFDKKVDAIGFLKEHFLLIFEVTANFELCKLNITPKDSSCNIFSVRSKNCLLVFGWRVTITILFFIRFGGDTFGCFPYLRLKIASLD